MDLRHHKSYLKMQNEKSEMQPIVEGTKGQTIEHCHLEREMGRRARKDDGEGKIIRKRW